MNRRGVERAADPAGEPEPADRAPTRQRRPIEPERGDLSRAHPPGGRPARQARVVANDERLLDAAIALIDERGADALTVADLVRLAGLTTGAFYARYDAIGDLLADLWLQRGAAVLAELARDALEIAAELPRIDPGRLAALLRATQERRVVFELLVVADRVPELADIIDDSVRGALVAAALIGATPAEADPIGLGLLAIALGGIAHDRIDGGIEGDAERIARWLRDARTRRWAGAPPIGAPPSEVSFVPSGEEEGAEEEGLELRRLRLLDAAGRVIARSGIARANLRRVSRASGYAHTVVYQEYGSLRELLVDYVRVVSEVQRAIAPEPTLYTSVVREAAWTAGLLAPAARAVRRLSLEFWIASAHDETFGGLTAEADRTRARAIATLLAPSDPVNQETVIRYRHVRSAFAFGLAALEQAMGGLGEVDWRPMIGSLLLGSLEDAGLEPA